MRTLYVHAGHGKTGTSFVQLMFYKNVEILQTDWGITYSMTPELIRDHERGLPTMGNGIALSRALHANDALPVSADTDHLFSSEQLFFDLSTPKLFERMVQRAQDAGFDRIRMLLFIRNPIAHATSAMLQAVKRNRWTTPIRQLEAGYHHPQRVAKLIDAFERSQGDIDLRIHNYSLEKAKISSVVSAWLGLDGSELVSPRGGEVNRSVNASEFRLQQAFNAYRTTKRICLGAALTYHVPDAPDDPLHLPMEVQRKIVERNATAMARVNAFAGTRSGYVEDFDTRENDGPLQFSYAQVETVARRIDEEIGRRDAVIAALRGDRAWRDGELERAIEFYRSARASDPAGGLYCRTLAKLLKDQGRVEEAIVHAREACKRNPENQEFKRFLHALRHKRV